MIHPTTTGVIATNGLGYARTMLTALAQGRPTTPLRTSDDQDRITRARVQDIETPAPGGGWLSLPFAPPTRPDALAMVSFTSGTEGTPKAVYLSQANLADVVTRLNSVMQVTDDIREYVGVPVTHSFGYGRCRAVLAAGGQVYLPEAGFDLAEIRRMLQAGQINALSAVPSLWRLFLSQRAMFGPELDAVRWVEIGSQFMSPQEKQALRAALPNAVIVQHYGLTEASRSTFLRIDTAADAALGSVGQPTGDVALRLSPEGRIQISGPHVAMGVDDGHGYRAIGAGDWFETSDLGRIEDGWLWFDGRADDVINCAGIKIVPDLAEADMRQAVPDAADFAVLRCDDALRGDGIMLAVTPQAQAQEPALLDALDAYAQGLGLSVRTAIQRRTVETLPRTDTGKVQRRQLAAQIASPPPTAPQPLPEGFAGFVAKLLGSDALTDGRSFRDLGGDSLTHMQMQLGLEQALTAVPPDWETLPLSDLVARADAAGDFTALTDAQLQPPPLPDGSRNENPSDLSFWRLVAEDFRTNDASLAHQGFWMLFIHRFGNWRMDVRPRLLRLPLTILYRVLNKLTQILFGMKLDYTVKVGRRVKLEHFGGMILGARHIGNDVVLRQNTTLGIRSTAQTDAKPIIGDFVDIGAGAVIVGHITVGENSIIGANSVIYTNVPPNSIVMGVPGRIIGTNTRRNPSPLGWDQGDAS